MNRAWLGTAVVAALAFVGLSIGLRAQVPSRTEAAGQTELTLGTSLDRPVPPVRLTDAQGRSASLEALRGKWVVLAPTATRCREACPITMGALLDLRARLRAAGVGPQVSIVAVSVDPWRDAPPRLRAYRRATGVGLPIWTGSVRRLRRFWRFFGVRFQRIPGDVVHTDGVFLIGPRGDERAAIAGPPRTGWSVAGVLGDLRTLTGSRGLDPSRRPRPAQGAGLLAGGESLSGRLEALRGRPVVLNAWASWCPPCREELPLFADAWRRFSSRADFIGADLEDEGESARRLLSEVRLPYRSYAATLAEVSEVAPARGPPVTIFIGPSGRVLYDHIGAYTSAADLGRDIRRYGFGH